MTIKTFCSSILFELRSNETSNQWWFKGSPKQTGNKYDNHNLRLVFICRWLWDATTTIVKAPNEGVCVGRMMFITPTEFMRLCASVLIPAWTLGVFSLDLRFWFMFLFFNFWVLDCLSLKYVSLCLVWCFVYCSFLFAYTCLSGRQLCILSCSLGLPTCSLTRVLLPDSFGFCLRQKSSNVSLCFCMFQRKFILSCFVLFSESFILFLEF